MNEVDEEAIKIAEIVKRSEWTCALDSIRCFFVSFLKITHKEFPKNVCHDLPADGAATVSHTAVSVHRFNCSFI